jgi:hypothetical protein
LRDAAADVISSIAASNCSNASSAQDLMRITEALMFLVQVRNDYIYALCLVTERLAQFPRGADSVAIATWSG